MHSTQRTGAVTWRMRQSRASAERVMQRASTLAMTGIGGVGEGDGLEVGRQALLRGLHEGAVEGGGDGWSMTVRLAPAALQSSAARVTAAVAPEMTVWSGELRLAGETTEPVELAA